MIVQAHLPCPYCGTPHVINVDLSVSYFTREFFLCEPTDGCGHHFVYTPTVKVTAVVDELALERRAYDDDTRPL